LKKKQKISGDEFHETLKKYNYRSEKGFVIEDENKSYSWKLLRKESWQYPVD